MLAARSEGKGTGKAQKPVAAEGGRARAADNATRDTVQGKGKGPGRTQAPAAAAQHGRKDVSRALKRAATGRTGRSRVRSANDDTGKDMGKDAGGTWASVVRSKDVGYRGRDPRHWPEDKGAGLRPSQG